MNGTVRRFEREVRQWDRIYDGTGPTVVRAWNAVTRANVRQRFDATFSAGVTWFGATLLDVGCGTGRYLARAATLGASRLVGIDASPAMLAVAAERLAATGHSARSELYDGMLPDDVMIGVRFDVVLVIGVLDYTPTPAPLLEAVAERCAGRAILTFPWRLAPRSVPRAAYWRFRGLTTRYYTLSEVRVLLSAAGLRVDNTARMGPLLFVVATPASNSS